jgi:hypothetical protein
MLKQSAMQDTAAPASAPRSNSEMSGSSSKREYISLKGWTEEAKQARKKEQDRIAQAKKRAKQKMREQRPIQDPDTSVSACHPYVIFFPLASVAQQDPSATPCWKENNSGVLTSPSSTPNAASVTENQPPQTSR